MNARERLLSLLLGSCLVLVLGYGGISTVGGWYASRETRLDELRRDLKRKKDELVRVQLAAQKLKDFEARSLPREVDVAQSLYQTWLIESGQQAQLSDVTITAPKPRAVQRTYHALNFTVTARGTLPQMIAWFYQLQQVDRLQRVENFSLKPLKNSKELLLNLTISAVAVNSAPAASELTPRLRENWPALDVYAGPILQRNLFGPPNQPPQFESTSPPKAIVGKAWEFTAKATDADPLDHVSYALANSTDANVKLDAASGRVSWVPAQLGEYEIEIVATDDDLPAKTTQQKYKVVVSDPPPPPPPTVEGPKKLAFDAAKYSVLTATLEVNGSGEAWLHNRISNEIMKLHVGDTFQIGSVSGKVREVSPESLDYEAEGKLYRLMRGRLLSEATISMSD